MKLALLLCNTVFARCALKHSHYGGESGYFGQIMKMPMKLTAKTTSRARNKGKS